MHADPNVVIWPDYQEFYRWLCHEVDGVSETQLDFDSQDPQHLLPSPAYRNWFVG